MCGIIEYKLFLLNGAEKKSVKMSTRGGYGFVLNGQEKIIYVGNGAEFGCLGETVLNWLRIVTAGPTTNQSTVLEQIANLAPVADITAMCSVDGLQNYDWHSIMRQVSYNPGMVLDMGNYIDSAWLIGNVDCEYLYIVDFDKGIFEIYYDTNMAAKLPASGRFNARTEANGTTREDAAYINMIVSFPFHALPESIGNFTEDIYEPEFWEAAL